MRNVGKFRDVVTALPSRGFCDVTNGNVLIRSERAKHLSRRTVVKLTSAYLNLDRDLLIRDTEK